VSWCPSFLPNDSDKYCTFKRLAALSTILCNPPSQHITIKFYSMLNNQSNWYRVVNQQPTAQPIALFPEGFCPRKASDLKIINGITNRNETCIQKWQNQGDFCISRKTYMKFRFCTGLDLHTFIQHSRLLFLIL